jgi:Ca2+-binding RTX toxin-like protein
LRGVDGIAVNDPAQAASQTLRVTAAALGSLQLVDLGAGHDVLEIDGSGNLVLAQKSVLGVEVVTTAFPEWSDDEVLIIDAANLRNLLRIDLGYRPDLDDKDESLDVIKLVGGGIFDFSSKIISGVERIVGGGQSAATVIGTKGHDRIDGGSGRDVLRGLGGQDSIAGGSGSDRLEGDSGRDKLTGGRGLDTFVFDTKPGSTNFDRIVDFSVRDDRIWLDNAVFKKLGRGTPASPVKLGEDAFFKGAQADDPEDRIIYNPGTGAVSYDPDGIGRAPAVKFAQVRKGLPLTNADFFVV